MKPFKTTTFVLAVTFIAAASAAPPQQTVRGTGRTLADTRLATDVLNQIAEFTRTKGACPKVDAVRMEVLPNSYVPRKPTISATSRGGHYERWSVDACGSRQQFQVGLWPAPQGGSDYAITPLTARVQIVSGADGAQPQPQPQPQPQRATGLSSWHGRYLWEESLGRIGGASSSEGVASFVSYTLALGPGNGATGCTLSAQGYQTMMRMQCTATPSGASMVTIKFYKFGADNVRGRHTMGERLLTLTRDGGGIQTQLEGLNPASDATARQGRLFRKIG